MGMEDRDWYREKRIDWNRGGLRERNPKRNGIPKFAWWVLAAVILIIVVSLLHPI